LRFAPIVLLCFAPACATVHPAPSSATRQELLEVERAFSRASQAHGAPAAFADNLAVEAVELAGSGPPIHGRDAIVASLQAKPGSTSSLTWEPDDAAVAEAGDLGYTWGHYTLTTQAAGKPPSTEQGKYLTIWRRDRSSQRWQAVVDIGN